MVNAGRLWALTTYYNPIGYRRRLANYLAFWRALTVRLVTVELGRGGAYELTPADADILVQIPDGSVLWQKERLLNIALAHVPHDAKVVAWLDGDIGFEREDWADAAVEAIEEHALVQLFDTIYDVRRDGSETPWAGPSAQPTGVAIAALTSRGLWNVEDSPSAPPPGRRQCGFGLAWAANRAIIETHHFYDAMILGGGDRPLVCAAYGKFDDAIRAAALDARRARHYLRWAQPFFQEVAGRVGYIRGALLHRWHGDLAKRRYLKRHAELARFEFDPDRDIAVADSGAWRWASDKPRLHGFVREYFQSRDEDGTGGSRTPYSQDAI